MKQIKNNYSHTLYDEKQHFSLRKLTIGVVPILLGLTFLSFNVESVHAETKTEDYMNNSNQKVIHTKTKNFTSNQINNSNIPTGNLKNKINSQQTVNKVSNQSIQISKSINSQFSLKKDTHISSKKVNILKGTSSCPKFNNTLITTKKINSNNLLNVKSNSSDISQKSSKSNLIQQPKRVSVHDPSIFQDPKTGKFYIFGSHQASAESDDLYNWKPLFKKEYEQPSYIFNNYDNDLKQIFKWAGSHDGDNKNGYAIWAPDEIYNSEYKWEDGTKGAYMYYFATSSSWIHSAIGYAISKTVHGPYKFKDTIIYSGFTKDKVHNGDNNGKNDIYTNTNLGKLISSGRINGFSSKWIRTDGTYNNDYAPNAIDVNIITDKNNNLWMSYGSWSGGIYLLPLNKETGEPIYPGKDSINKYGQHVDRYFGTHLIGGFHESGEAPYIKYDKNTGYYYLFITYGGLTREGGYNMRLFRSKEIDGRYVDAMGQHPIYTSWKTNDVTKQENQKYGIKLEGNYNFSCLPYAYMSPGHNSAYIDKKGNWYLINHTRFNHGTEYYETRVKSMIMTQNGWPIPLPFEYTGKEKHISKDNIDDIVKQIPGKYEFVNNGIDTNSTPIPRASIQLISNHKVTGSINGNWNITLKNNKIFLTIFDSTNHKYIGEFKLQQDESKEHKTVLVFAALGNNNEVIWGEKLLNKTHLLMKSNDSKKDISIGDSSLFTTTTDNIKDDYVSFSLMHNAFIYDKNGKRVTYNKAIKTYTKVPIIRENVFIKGRKFYQFANTSQYYLTIGNIDGKTRKLTHNAYIFNHKGIRIKKHVILKKGTNQITYGTLIMIHNKLFYRIGIGQYIKASNFK